MPGGFHAGGSFEVCVLVTFGTYTAGVGCGITYTITDSLLGVNFCGDAETDLTSCVGGD